MMMRKFKITDPDGDYLTGTQYGGEVLLRAHLSDDFYGKGPAVLLDKAAIRRLIQRLQEFLGEESSTCAWEDLG
jgi:hypothetical protein